MPSPLGSRAIFGTSLLATGAVALPVAATFLDHPPGRENLILPAQFSANLAIGAGLGAALPKIAGQGTSSGRGAVVGAIAGVVAAAVADVGWALLIGG